MTRAPLAVLGVGGIGGMLAARTGAVCVGTERTVETLRARGLTLSHHNRTTTARPEAVTRLERPVALLVVCVKAYDLDAALDRIAPAALDGAVVLPLLNGLEHVDALRARFEDATHRLGQASPTVAAGSIGRVSASSPEPGVVVLGTDTAGTVAAASRDADRETLAAALRSLEAAVEIVVRDDEREVLWEKAARLAVLAAATVASRLAVGALRSDAAWRERMQTALDEAVRVAARDGVEVPAAAQWAMIEAMPSDLTTSAARDAAARRPTELDAITGSVVRAGVRLGVPTPALTALFEEAACRAR